MTDNSGSQRDQIDELAESFVARYRAGERPSIEEYARKYPELADQLRQLLPALVMLEQHGSLDGSSERAQGSSALRSAPSEIGEFTIVREIGRGGMGVVYEAVQQSLGRHVALKVLSSPGLLNPTHLERFRLEARAAGRLHHSHIVPVFGVGEHDGLHYYAMQFIPGQSLDQVIDALRELRPGRAGQESASDAKSEHTESIAGALVSGQFQASDDQEPQAANSKLPSGASSGQASATTRGEFSNASSGRPFFESVARVGLQIAEALAYAHAEGILHRDIKPSNLILDAKGNTWVTDFGLVKLDDSQALTETGDFVGTLRYMAPERLEGWADRRSDIYGLGATLYELLTLHTFFGAANRAQLVDCIRNVQPKPPTKIDPAIPRDLETIVLKALAKEPAARYRTADEMAEDLRRFLADRPILARRSTASERFVRWCRRNPAVAALTATAAAALIAGTVASTWQAVRATRAERLAQDERAQTEAQRIQAERNYQKAKAAVDKYFTLVSESTLFDVPGLYPLRKELLEGALQFYEDAALERSSDPAVLVDAAVTNLRLGQVYIGLDRADDAIAAYSRALELIDQLRREHPAASDHERKLAGFWRGLRLAGSGVASPKEHVVAPSTDKRQLATGESIAGMRHNLDSIRTLLRLVDTWTQLAERHPSEPKFRRDLAAMRAQTGWALVGLGRREEGIAMFRRGLEVNAELVREFPAATEYRADRCTGLNLFVQQIRSTADPQELLSVAREAVQFGESVVSDAPSNPVHRQNLVESLTYLGRYASALEPQTAEQALGRAIELTESLLREFPDNQPYQEGLIAVTSAWVEILVTSGGESHESDRLQKTIETLEAQLKLRPRDRLVRERLVLLCDQAARRVGELRIEAELAQQLDRRAKELAAELAEEFPEDGRLIVQLGQFHRSAGHRMWSAGRPDEAAERFLSGLAVMEEAIRQRPEWDYDVRLLADLTIDLARGMAGGARISDGAAACRLCASASQMLDQKLKEQDPARRVFLAVAVRAYCERLLKDPKHLPEAEEMMAWSSPLVEQAIEDGSVLDEVIANRTAHPGFRHMAATTQQWLAKILGWTDRPAEADQMWQRAIRSYAAIADDHPDQLMHLQATLQDYYPYHEARVKKLVEAGQSEEAAATSREYWKAAEATLLKVADKPELLPESIGPTFGWAAALASLSSDPEGKKLIDQAIQSLEARVANNPQDQMARFRLALLAHRLADRVLWQEHDSATAARYWRLATPLFRELAEKRPTDTVLLEQVAWSELGLGEATRRAGEPDEAREAYKASAKTWATLSGADRSREDYCQMWRAHALINVVMTPTSSEQVDETLAAGRESVEICESLVRRFPDQAEYHDKVSWAASVLSGKLIETGRAEEAVHVARRQIELCETSKQDLEPQLAGAYLMLSHSLLANGQIEESKDAWKRALESGPPDAERLNAFAWDSVARTDVEPAVTELAVQAAEQAVQANPGEARFWNTLGVVQYRAGKWDDVVTSLTKSQELAADSHMAFDGFFLAMAHWQLGHKDEAGAWYDRSVAWMEKNRSENVELIRFRAEAEKLLGTATTDSSSEPTTAGSM